ncbi:MAG: FG-GAP-like repeat-containing protein [Rhizomicrobium sp.]
MATDVPPLMTVPGTFSVDPMGAATYSLPLMVTPGTAGMMPALSLNYSSQAGDGIVGKGWALSGLSAIGRCPRTVAQDGIHGGVNYDSNDRFCMNGQHLVLISGTYGADGSEYRTEIESFSRVIAHGTAGNGPAWFEVHTKAGQVLEFGNTADSRVLAVGKATARVWAVDKVLDAKGNYYSVTYTNDATNGQAYPTRIDYTGNAAAGLSPYNSVQFTYNTSRADVVPTYQAGSLIQTTVLLTNVKAYAGANLVVDYRLGYRAGTSLTHSRLTSLTQCDASGACLAPTSFTWQGGTGTLTVSSASAGANSMGLAIVPGDFNGDGLTDAVFSLAYDGTSFVPLCPTGGTVNFGSQAGTFATGMTMATPLGGGPGYSGPACLDITAAIDIDGDGFADAALPLYSAGHWLPKNPHALLLNDRAGHLGSIGIIGGVRHPLFGFGDFNGDGRADYISETPSTVIFTPNFGDGVGGFTAGPPFPSLNDVDPIFVHDFDGDGCDDVNQDWIISYSCAPAVAQAAGGGSSINPTYGDFNGDGKTDALILSPSGPGTMTLSTGTGMVTTAFPTPAAWGGLVTIVPGDFDGDGKTDLAVVPVTATSASIYLSTGTGFTLAATIPLAWASSGGYGADWNNDGATDLWINTNSGFDTIYTFGYVPELITAISNGVGATTTITYDRLNHGTIYTKGSGAAYPAQDVVDARYVVSRVDAANGMGGTYAHTYAYSGLKSDLSGRGILGFSQMVETNLQDGTVKTLNFRTDFPYTGEVSSSTLVHGATTLSTVSNTFGATNLGGTRNFVFLSQSVVSGHDLDGSTLPTTTTNYTYDTYGNALTVAVAVSDGSSKTTTNTYSNDAVHWFLGRLTNISVTSVVGASTITRTSGFTYDAATGLLTEEVIEPGNAAYRLYTDYTYDAYGNRIQSTVSGSGIATRVSHVGYDARGEFATSTTNALSQSDSTAYDPGFAQPTSHTDPNGITTGWSYDSFGRRTLETRPDGTKTALSYAYCAGVNGGAFACPANGAYVAQATPQNSGGTQNGPAGIVYYDSLGRVIATDAQGFSGAWIRTARTYDANGFVHQTSRPYFVSGGTPKWTVNVYDDLGRVTQTTFPDGSHASFAFHGLTVSATNNLSQTTSITRNAQGLNASVTDAAGHATGYVYDAYGSLLTVTDSVGNVTSNTYDLRGNKTASSDPDMGSWSYVYDVLGELTSQTDAKSQTTTLTYDVLGRPLSRTEAGLYSAWAYGSSAASHNIGRPVDAQTCTAAGCASVASDRSFAYDALGRPTTMTLVIGSNTYVYTTAYDSDGRPATVAYPSGFVRRNAYTALGYLSQVKDDASGAVLWTVNSRDAELNATLQTAGNGVATTQTFDPNTGALTAVRAGTGGAVAAFDYAYDTLGNLTSRSDTGQAVFEKFCYDALNRLTASATAASTPAACTAAGAGIVSKSVSYDAVGNITAKSDVGTYAYPTPGPSSVRPHAVSAIAGTVNGVANPSYSYDANGNLTGGAGRSIAYSSFNRTRSIAQGGTADCLAYDTEHNRLRMDSYAAAACSGTPSASTTYLNDPVSGMGSEKVVAGAVTTWHDYLTVDGALVGERSCSGAAPCSSGASWLYFVSDHLGSIAVITDGSGAVAQRLSYDAWGRRRNADGSDNPGCTITAVTSRGYTGHEMLDSVCQVNANARLYDPTIARFLSPDGIVPNPFGSQSLNRYAYVENGPLSATDPSGNELVIVPGTHPPVDNGGDGPKGGGGGSAAGGGGGMAMLAGLYNHYRQLEMAAVNAQWLHASLINAADADAAHQAANQVKSAMQSLGGMDAQMYDTSAGAGIGGNAQGENTEAAASVAITGPADQGGPSRLDSNGVETVVVTPEGDDTNGGLNNGVYYGGVGPEDIASKSGFGAHVVGIPLPNGVTDPLDPKGLNKPMLTPIEAAALQRTVSIVKNGTAQDLAALNPHPYMNFPSKQTGAVLPPGAYVSLDVQMGSFRGDTRLIVDSSSLQMYYTNTHYNSFYPVH